MTTIYRRKDEGTPCADFIVLLSAIGETILSWRVADTLVFCSFTPFKEFQGRISAILVRGIQVCRVNVNSHLVLNASLWSNKGICVQWITDFFVFLTVRRTKRRSAVIYIYLFFCSESLQLHVAFLNYFSFYLWRFLPGCCRAMDQRAAALCDNYGRDVLWRRSTLRRLLFN